MSYILDALRKADAERRGVAAPVGLTEPAVLVANDDSDPDLPASRAPAWWWVGGGVAVALAAAVGWHFWRGATEAVVPPQVAVAPTAPPPAAPAPPPQPAPVQQAPAPAADADALPRFPPPLPDAQPRTPSPPPPPRDVPRDASPAGAREPLPTLPPARAQNAAPPPGITMVNPAPAAAPAANRVWAYAELPDAVRRDFPKLTVNGAMYSERASDRMVVINGQVLHEGEKFGPELTLRQIRLKAAVFDFRGYKVQITW